MLRKLGWICEWYYWTLYHISRRVWHILIDRLYSSILRVLLNTTESIYLPIKQKYRDMWTDSFNESRSVLNTPLLGLLGRVIKYITKSFSDILANRKVWILFQSFQNEIIIQILKFGVHCFENIVILMIEFIFRNVTNDTRAFVWERILIIVILLLTTFSWDHFCKVN